ncbi:MAG: hypothetical protein KC421_27450, partial [Anaerolineales bacterium]|nr:hypothetical protein [Anaerolineales bacterium]
EAWFDLLDQVEAEAGLRDAGQEDSFSRNGLAIEAATTAAPWNPTITYGESLFDTKLDTDETAVTQLKNDLYTAIQSGDATAGFAQALEQAYAINHPPPYAAAAAAAVALGAAGLGGYQFLARPALKRRRRRQEQLAHLSGIRQNIANLLLACERLISGETIDDAVIYQLFAAYGGEQYPDRKKAVRQWLKQSRAALRSAFDLRRALEIQEEDAEAKPAPLEKQIHDWEMIYLTLVGSSEEVHNLTEAELRDLLDPMVIMEREARDVPLAEQLNDIRRQIEGMPFKITLQEVDLTKADKEGILGYLTQVETQIGELMAAQTEAPRQLDEARRDHLAVKEAADEATPFGLTGSEITAGVAADLAAAAADLEAGAYFEVLATAVTIQRNLDIIEDLLDAAADYEERQEQQDAILAQGYRPATTDALAAEIAEDIQQIKQQVSAGDYPALAEWIDELDADGQRTLDSAAAWREQHQFNAEFLALMQEQLTKLEQNWAEKTAPAWEKLAAYPKGNWESLADEPDAIAAAIRQLRDADLPQIEQWNSLDVQQVTEAETLLTEVEAALAEAERRSQAIVNRLAEVETAVTHLPEGLRLAAADLERAVQFRDAADAQIGPEIDQQLAAATAQLAQANRQFEERNFIAAAAAQTAVREAANAAYAEAAAQVKRISELQQQLKGVQETAVTQTRTADRESASLSALMQTPKTARLAQEMADQLSAARQAANQTLSLEDHALAEALVTAVAAFTAAAELAAQLSGQAQQNRQTYQQQQRETRQAIHDAQQAIRVAEQKVDHRHARGTGTAALARARRTLPLMPDGREATRSALGRTQKQAEEAHTYAVEARRKAEQAIAQWQREHQPAPSTSGNWPYGGGLNFPSSGSSFPRPRPRPHSSHSSSSGSSHRPRPSGSSHRPSSSGSSRRSGSSGSSRRSSGGRSGRR